MATTVDERLLGELQRKLDIWYWNGVVWERTHWVLGTLGIAFSSLSAADIILDGWAAGFAVATTICLGILGFANPLRRSARYFRSYRILDPALREYKFNLLTLDQILAEHRRAEEFLDEAEDIDVDRHAQRAKAGAQNAAGPPAQAAP